MAHRLLANLEVSPENEHVIVIGPESYVALSSCVRRSLGR